MDCWPNEDDYVFRAGGMIFADCIRVRDLQRSEPELKIVRLEEQILAILNRLHQLEYDVRESGKSRKRARRNPPREL